MHDHGCAQDFGHDGEKRLRIQVFHEMDARACAQLRPPGYHAGRDLQLGRIGIQPQPGLDRRHCH